MLSSDPLPMDIGAKYFDGYSCLLQKAPQVFGRKTHHIRQFEKAYGMRTIITIVKADYCLMSQLLLSILSNVTLPRTKMFFTTVPKRLGGGSWNLVTFDINLCCIKKSYFWFLRLIRCYHRNEFVREYSRPSEVIVLYVALYGNFKVKSELMSETITPKYL